MRGPLGSEWEVLITKPDVFTLSNLLTIIVKIPSDAHPMDVLCSGCSQPSHHCIFMSAWMYRALGIHNQVITAFLCQHGCIVLDVFTTKSLLPF
ncbi:hypothetical protein DPMN_018544 [Dreissena polymorpha]|uniref:Uncharacterized protein n=1 Tax=Dreissena polymorpha TaxID=45954 RepID=A0A9D4NJI5_DREPO|nr:hypothetical protein DPMN_018544 [Dreissena polymorpha]